MVAARKRRNIKFGEIAWLDLDPTRGNEQRGRRPVLVVSQNAYNKKTHMRIACPITTQKKGWPFEVDLFGTQTTGCVLVDQLKCMDFKARHAEFIEAVANNILDEVTGKIEALLVP